MATIRQKGLEQWHAQVRRTGWPPVTETLRTRKEAEAWARDVESQMDRGIFVDRSAGERTTLARPSTPTSRRSPRSARAKALPGNPYDGHTLRAAIEDTERLTGRQIERAYVDKGYRGHDAPNPHRVFISGQKRGVFGAIKRELRRRSAIEPVIGRMKAEGHLGRCYLKGTAGDAANAILTAIGHNLRLVLAWLRALLRLVLDALWRDLVIHLALKSAS